ncbi:hypothetical protein [Actinomadura madurae]|uniref:hypothetical protein n=1 Tax=Actinomadura madurae TaxID=1993 RepID=UPI0020D2345B|nr:hypothetical protein [Actinomadura madurae]MCP9982757.1 hypothetical protein [Actinomadura madurae]
MADREHYADLLRLAYLVLDDGDAPLMRARRAAAGAARGRPGGYPAMRARLVGILLTGPPPAGHRPHRLFVEPGRGSRRGRSGRRCRSWRRTSGSPTCSASTASPHPRSPPNCASTPTPTSRAWTGPPPPWTAGRGWTRPRSGPRSRRSTPASSGSARRAPSPAPRWRPCSPRCCSRSPRSSSPARTRGPARRRGRPARVAGHRHADHPRVAAQGALRHDTALLRRAAGAWRADRRDPPHGRVVLLYAGTVDGSSLVVLRDSPGLGDPPSIAQYFERRLSRGVESVRRLGTGAGQLIMLGMTWRYLVPPWMGELRAAVPSERSADWVQVAVRDGLSDPLPWRWFTPRCQNYVAFQMTYRPAGGGEARTITQLASHDPRSAAPLVWFRDPPERRDRFRWAALHALACEGAATLTESGDLKLGHLWSGSLPDGGGRAMLLTVDSSLQQGVSGTSILISDTGRALSERGRTNSAAVSSAGTMAAALWWRSSRRWHLVAAAGPNVARLKTVGELGAHDTKATRPGETPLLTVPGPPVGEAPAETTHLPIVQVVAYEHDGDRTTVSPS